MNKEINFHHDQEIKMTVNPDFDNMNQRWTICNLNDQKNVHKRKFQQLPSSIEKKFPSWNKNTDITVGWTKWSREFTQAYNSNNAFINNQKNYAYQTEHCAMI